MKYVVSIILVCVFISLQGCSSHSTQNQNDVKQAVTENKTYAAPVQSDNVSLKESNGTVDLIPESRTETGIDSHFGVHPGGLKYETAAPLIKELGTIYVREELFEDSGWRHFKTEKPAESTALCKEYCIPTEYTDCNCTDGIYYADMHPGTNHVSGISFYENEFNLLVTILNYTNSKKEPPNFLSTYNPKIESIYREYLDYLLTGMPDVQYWQIANEVDLAFWSGTAEDYLEMVRVSYSYIKQRNPEYQVGVSFNSQYSNLSLRWVEVLKQLGEQCDFIDAHLLPVDGMDMRKLNAMDLSGWQALCPDAELISTETGLPDQKLHPDWGGLWGLGGTREKQAEDLIKYCTMLFDKGYGKIFWFLSDFDFEPIDDDLFEHAGLVTREGEPKPGFFAYKTLISKVDGFLTVKKLDEGQYKYTFSDRSPVYVVWGTGDTALHKEITGTVIITKPDGTGKKTDVTGLKPGDSPIFIEIVD